jgi:hypothetical protein
MIHSFIYNNQEIVFEVESDLNHHKFVACNNPMFIEIFPFGQTELINLDNTDLKHSDFFEELLFHCRKYV